MKPLRTTGQLTCADVCVTDAGRRPEFKLVEMRRRTQSVIADMFGITLRTYHRRVREMEQCRSALGNTVWDASRIRLISGRIRRQAATRRATTSSGRRAIGAARCQRASDRRLDLRRAVELRSEPLEVEIGQIRTELAQRLYLGAIGRDRIHEVVQEYAALYVRVRLRPPQVAVASASVIDAS